MKNNSRQTPLPFLGAKPQVRLYPSKHQFEYIVLCDLRKSISKFAEQMSGRILDLGCGVKPYTPLFNNISEYIGADFPGNPYADVNFDPHGRLPANVSLFDSVVSFQVLEHVPEVEHYLTECRRVLRDKGTLLLTTHGIWEYHPGPLDLYRWTHEGLTHTVERYGFKTQSVESVTSGARSLLQIVALRIERQSKLRRRLKGLIYWAINQMADRLGEDSNTDRRLYDFPVCYAYFGIADAKREFSF